MLSTPLEGFPLVSAEKCYHTGKEGPPVLTLGQILHAMPPESVTTQICGTLSDAFLIARACRFVGFSVAISSDRHGDIFVAIRKKAAIH